MGSPLGAENYNSFLLGAASLKGWEPLSHGLKLKVSLQLAQGRQEVANSMLTMPELARWTELNIIDVTNLN